jgi:hypothetical protein
LTHNGRPATQFCCDAQRACRCWCFLQSSLELCDVFQVNLKIASTICATNHSARLRPGASQACGRRVRTTSRSPEVVATNREAPTSASSSPRWWAKARNRMRRRHVRLRHVGTGAGSLFAYFITTTKADNVGDATCYTPNAPATSGSLRVGR